MQNKVHFFAGEDVSILQNFSKPQQQQSLLPSSDRFSNIHEVEESKSVYQSKMLQQPPLQDFPLQRMEIDLGRQYFEVLQREYQRRNQIKTNNPDALYQLYKMLRIKRNNEKMKDLEEQYRQTISKENQVEDKRCSKDTQVRLAGKLFKDKDQSSQRNSDVEFLKQIIKSNPQDVRYTLHLHSEEAQKEHNISIYLQERGEILKSQNKIPKKKKLTQEVQSRLYPKEQVKLNEESQIQQKPQFQIFCEKLMEIREKEFPMLSKAHSLQRNQKELFIYWDKLPNRNQVIELSVDGPTAQKLIQEYFYNLAFQINKNFNDKQYSLKPNSEKNINQSSQTLLEFWKNSKKHFIKAMEKLAAQKIKLTESDLQYLKDNETYRNLIFNNKELKLYGYDMDLNDMEKIIKDYFIEIVKNEKENQKKLEAEVQGLQRDLEEKKKQKEVKYKIDRSKEEMIQHVINKLSKHADKLKVGKAMLKLQKLFPKDKELREMILQEFSGKNNKLIKHPAEYELYDSDEEKMMLGISTQISKKQKEQQIAQKFSGELDEFQRVNRLNLSKQQQMATQSFNEEKQAQRFLKTEAKNFVELRKKRLTEKIPPISEIFARIYQNLKNQMPAYTKRTFKRETRQRRNQHQQLPNSFKRCFFKIIKEYVNGKLAKIEDLKMKGESTAGKIIDYRVPTWFPTQGSKCKIHEMQECPLDCRYQTLNRKAMDKAKLFKQGKKLIKLREKIQQTLWNNPNLCEEKLNFLMTFSDAQELTFKPLISRVEKELKEKKQQPYTTPKLEDMNVVKEKITHNKYGIFKQALALFHKGDYIESYKKIAENFNILSIKKIFEGEDQVVLQQDDPYSMFSWAALGTEKEFLFSQTKWPKELTFFGEKVCQGCKSHKHRLLACQRIQLQQDKDLKTHAAFLEDVYSFINAIEDYDRELIQQRKIYFPKMRLAIFLQALKIFKTAKTKQEFYEIYRMIFKVFHLESILEYFSQKSQQINQQPDQQNLDLLSPTTKLQSAMQKEEGFMNYPFKNIWDFVNQQRDQKMAKNFAWFICHEQRADKLQKENFVPEVTIKLQEQSDSKNIKIEEKSLYAQSQKTNIPNQKKSINEYALLKSIFLLVQFLYRVEKLSIQDFKKKYPQHQIFTTDQINDKLGKEETEKINEVVKERLEQENKEAEKNPNIITKQKLILQIESNIQALMEFHNIGAINSLMQTQNLQQFFLKNQSKFNAQQNIAKTIICPLKDKCPDDIRPRWPASQIKSVTQLGYKCPFAHHVYELKFNQELKNRKQILSDMFQGITQRLTGSEAKKAWNPGGGIFTECIGCGRQLTKVRAKGVCQTCDIKFKNIAKLEKYKVKAKQRFETIVSSKQFTEHKKETEKFDNNLNKKIGYLQQAKILFKKERYSEAFKAICKAVQLVKAELNEKCQKEEKMDLTLRKKLDIDPYMEITAETVYQKEEKEEIELQQLESSLNSSSMVNKNLKQKIHYFANKTGVIGEKKLNINDFVNYQIELTYNLIQKQLLSKVQDIKIMQQRIDKLEGDGEQQQIQNQKQRSKSPQHHKLPRTEKKEMCSDILKLGICIKYEALKAYTEIANQPIKRHERISQFLNFCLNKLNMQKGNSQKQEELIQLVDKVKFDPCQYAHFPTELDMKDNETKASEMAKVIKHTKKLISVSNAPVTWQPPSKQDAIKNINEFDKYYDIHQLEIGKKIDKNKSILIRDSTPPKQLFDNDIEELTKLPFHKVKFDNKLE